ncbi:MAG: hypothetical protein ACP5DZ_08000 [Bacteroidales bacterium]
MMMYAGIDIGTNTCNLSVAGWEAHRLHVVRSEKPIKPWGRRIFRWQCTGRGTNRLVNVLISYKAIIEQYPVKNALCLPGTAKTLPRLSPGREMGKEYHPQYPEVVHKMNNLTI